jgi:histidine triad (HIT) family protein
MDCIFCKIIRNEIDYFKVWENKKFLAFLDRMPINPGHILLIPKKHQEEIFDLEDSSYIDIFKIAKKISKPLKLVTKAKRIGIAIEGLGVPHAHIHLVPIYNGNELNPERAKRVTEDELKQMQKNLSKSFELI